MTATLPHPPDDSVDIALPDGGRWRPWHTWVDGSTTQVDGAVWLGDRMLFGLDVVALGDGCCLASDCPDLARRDWEAGTVHAHVGHCAGCGVTALVLPTATVDAGTVTAAVGRWVTAGAPRGSDVLPVCVPQPDLPCRGCAPGDVRGREHPVR